MKNKWYRFYLWWNNAELDNAYCLDKDKNMWNLYWNQGTVYLCTSEKHSYDFALAMSYYFIKTWKNSISYPNIFSTKMEAYSLAKNND